MGTDNLKADQIRLNKEEKVAKKVARRAAKRALHNQGRSVEIIKPLERILIVCEGEATEPLYFSFLIEHFKLSTADVKVTGDGHSCPYHVVTDAEKLYNKSLSNKKVYDKVFCVIDRDSHARYDEALTYIRTLPSDIFYIINSIPCFELWLLLHYEYTIKSFDKTAKRSICESLIKDDLRRYLPNYEKNISNLTDEERAYIFNDDNIKTAISNAEKGLSYCKKHEIDNPSTKIHTLLCILQELKDNRKKILK